MAVASTSTNEVAHPSSRGNGRLLGRAPRRSVLTSVLTVTSTPAPSKDVQLPMQSDQKGQSNQSWAKSIQTKVTDLWETWHRFSTHKISPHITRYSAVRHDMAGQAQELLDATFHRVVDAIAAAAAAAPASSTAADAATSRPTLTPYLTIADQVEVGFAAMLADLCNMAYEVDKIDTEALYERHRLSLVATSVSFCPITPAAAVVGGGAAIGAAPGLSGADAEIAAAVAAVSKASAAAAAASSRSSPAAHPLQQHEQQQPSALNATIISSGHLEEVAPTMVSFSRGGPGAHASGVSVLQLTSPEAVTAALASQGHGSAFANPVYVSTLHHALVSMGSYDEEGDISDLEWRAAMAAAGPQQPRGGSLGTLGTMDEMLLGGQAAAAQQQHVAAVGAPAMMGQEVTPALLGDALAASPAASRSASTFFSDANLNEERDFVSGQVYGYQTPLVERRRSSTGGVATAGSSGMLSGGAGEELVSAVTQSGAAGGRALREEQAQRPRRSMSGGYLPSMEEVDIGASAGTVGLGQGQAGVDVAAGPPVVVACAKAPPSAWFAADDKLTKTRYFAIQGSTSMEHWQINLQFEPQVFEDGRYGVRVHRGVYEAAKVLYDDLLPLVQQHIESSPHATVSFTGHSLGGSLGVVLMLLYVVRGVLKPHQIAPIYTYGAPAVFCQGGMSHSAPDRCERCDLRCEARPNHHAHHLQDRSPEARTEGFASHSSPSSLPGSIAATAASMEQVQSLPLGLLAALGLTNDHVVNVIMHKDIVPRAFVCDYTVVAGMLQRWWPSFRDHPSLSSKGPEGATPHKSLYNFVGRVAVLRPSVDMPFVNGPADAMHPMLPNYPALYRVGVDEDVLFPLLDHAAASLASWDELLDGTAFAAAMSAVTGGCRKQFQAAADKRAARLAGMQHSVMHFMNQPHPLTTLSDYQAYGPNGCISRFHNPDNYTQALRHLSNHH